MPKVDIPRVGVVEFPDTMSQEQILRAIETDIIPNYQRPEYGVIESGIKGLKRGASRMGSMITDTIPALIGSGLGFDEYAKRQLEEGAQKEAELQRTNPAQFTSYKQVEGLGDAFRFGAETLGESVPDILGIIGTGGVGGALGKRAAVKGAEQLAGNIAKREAIRDVLPGGVSAARAAELEAAAVREAAPAIQKAQATGQAAGVYLGSYATNTPDVFQSIYENTNQLAPGASLLFGGAVAALDAVLPGQLLKSMTQTEKLSIAEKILERSGMKPSLLRKATVTIPQTAAKEGLTEGAQEVITAMAEKFVDDHQDIWDSEHFNRYIESAVRGAVAGGPFGGVQAVGERMGERGRDRQIQQAQQAEEARVAAEQEARVAAEQEAQAQIQAEQEAQAQIQGEQLPLFQPGELPKLPPQLEVPSTVQPAPVEEAIQPSGQMELFAPQTNPKTQPKPTLEADVRVLEKKLKEVEKQKIAEGKEADQAQKEAIAELAPKDIDLLNYAKRVGITSTPLYQLTQQAAEIQPRKGAKPIQQIVPPVQEEPPAVAASLLTADRLKETGLSPRAGIYKRLLDKDLVANADDIRAEIANAQNNPNISKNTITALQSLEAGLPTAEQVAEEPVAPQEQAAPVPEPVAPQEQAAPVPEPVAPQEQPAAEELPADIWEFMDTGVPYEELDAAKKTEWEQAVQARTSNQSLADDLAVSHLQSPTPQEPLDIGEREAVEFETPLVTEEPTTAPVLALPDLTNEEKKQLKKLENKYDDLDLNPDLNKNQVRQYAKQLMAAKVIDENEYNEIDRILRDRDMEALDALSELRSYAYDIESQYRANKQKRAALEKAPHVIEGEFTVVAETVGREVKKLGQSDTQKLESHYGAKAGTKKFLEAVKEDVIKFANEGAEAVSAAIRNIIKTIHAGVLAVAMIFNPMTISKTPDSIVVMSKADITYTQQVKAQVPAQAAAKMSASAKEVYETLYPGIKDRLMQENKLLIITDKPNARVFVFNPDGSLLLEKKVLVGRTVGDFWKGNTDVVANRITPAGLFTMGLRDAKRSVDEERTAGHYDFKKVFVLDKAIEGEYSVTLFHSVWLHESDAAMRAQALKNDSATDSRYSFGCINVDKATYKYLVDNHLQQMDGAALFIVPDNQQLTKDFLTGAIAKNQQRVDDLTRTTFEPATKTVTIPGIKQTTSENKKFRSQTAIREEELYNEPSSGAKRSRPAAEPAGFEDSDLKKAFNQVGEELSKLASSIGAKQNLMPEEEASLGRFMSALGNLMYELVKSGAKTFAQALPLAKKRATEELGDLAKYVPDTAYKTAHDQVAKAAEAKPISPAKQREENKNVFEKISNANVDNMPPMTQKLAGEVLNTASGLPRVLRRVWLGALSLYQMHQIYGGIIPSIKALDNALTVRDTDISKRREIVEQKVRALHAVFSKYTAAQKEKFFTIFQNTTLDQIDPLTVTVKETINSNGQAQRTRTYELKPNAANAANPLVKQFYAMPKDVQEAYMDLRKTYDESADEFEKLITKDVTPGTAAKLRTQFELRRIKVYLPLFRQGEYWLSYQDKAGEPVVMAFPSERERQLEVQRAHSTGMKEIKEFARFEDIASRTNGVPPVGFVSKIMDTLKDEQVSPLVLDEVYSAYLSLFPAESVRQMTRARKGIAGANIDAVEVYANVGSRLANQLGNLTHAKSIDEAVNNIRQEGNANGSIEARDVGLDIAERVKNVTAPTTNKLVSDVSSAASSASYYMYIAGNASSAIINLTQLPIVVYSLLGGKYGFTDAFNAMSKATSMYLNGGKDDNSTFLPDRTFVTGKNVSAEHKALYEDAVKYGIIRRSTAHELVDLRKHTAGDYTGMGAKVRTTLGWMFQNSERANREITLLAAYDLARKKGASPEAARQEAMNLVTEAHGGALSSTGPRYFQGNLGRVVFTFKRFATSQLYLMGKLFNQAFRDADPEIREVARRQLLGIYAMAFTFAGAQGVPLYGALSLLAGMVMGDDDEPVDTDAIITEAIGDMAYKGPINQLLNIDIASRTGFNGMFWRDNPKRRSEVGTLTYLLEQAAGPSFSAAVNAQKAFGMISDGYVYRGFESMSPVAVKNVMKGMRYIAEGATNKDGVPIVQDVSLYNALMQLGGFAPADLSEAYARAGAKKTTEKALLERRAALLDLHHVAKQNGDTEGMREIRERMQVFSQKNPEKSLRITSDTISRSERSHKQREREMVDGVHINKNLRRRLDDLYGTADEED